MIIETENIKKLFEILSALETDGDVDVALTVAIYQAIQDNQTKKLLSEQNKLYWEYKKDEEEKLEFLKHEIDWLSSSNYKITQKNEFYKILAFIQAFMLFAILLVAFLK